MNVTTTNALSRALATEAIAVPASNMTIRLATAGPFSSPAAAPLDFTLPSFTGLSALTGQNLTGPFLDGNGTAFGRTGLLSFNNTSGTTQPAVGVIAYTGNVTTGSLVFAAQFSGPVGIPDLGQLSLTIDVPVPSTTTNQPNPSI